MWTIFKHSTIPGRTIPLISSDHVSIHAHCVCVCVCVTNGSGVFWGHALSCSPTPPPPPPPPHPPNHVRFSCCSPTVSASAAALRLHQLQLLPDCFHFSCCSPTASASAPRLHPLALPDYQPFWKVPALLNILKCSSLSSRFRGCSRVQWSHVTSLVLPN